MSSLDTRTCARIAQDLAAETRCTGVADRATRYALAVTHASDGGLDVLNDQHLEQAAASSERASAASDLQESTGEGPGYDAARTGETLLVRDAAHDGRWPLWGPAVAELGLNCMVSTPLRAGGASVGAMYVFSPEPDGLDEDAANLQLLGTHVTVAMRSARRQESLRHDMSVRNMIGQAQGILMEHYHLDAQTAADLLLEVARRTGSDLQAVAEHVVAGGELPGCE